MPRIWFLYIGSYVCSTLLSDPASRRRPCVSLSLHLHQVVKRTFTFELSNMLGTLGIGAAVTRRPLPHHRTYGSVHGGSSRLRRRFFEQGWKAERGEVRVREPN